MGSQVLCWAAQGLPRTKIVPCSDSVGTLSALQVINLSNKIVIARLEIVLQASAPHMLV